jgi:hypothetical protein
VTTRNLFSFADYVNAAVMFTLPIGSANLLVHEKSATYNAIGLCMIFCNCVSLTDSMDNKIHG